ncbi:M4 family metallopeptidase [Paractinoplanes durhamensis]|uniref:M4 family metallopeptidase n=1 Tax=Paractinoplanes durhamensis TaxID=113563 RepID=UPI00362B23A0
MQDQTHKITTWDARGRDYYELMGGAWPEGLAPFASPSTTLGADLTDAGAVDAAWDAGKVFEWYQAKLGRNSLDDNGMPIDSIVGITYGGYPWVNAYWDGTRMVYGSGDDEYLPLSADPDVVGHEMTHGVVEHTANLVYAGQSGALNEALADYFGNAIDVDASGTSMSDPQASLLGGDLCRTLAPADCALRDLDDGATTADFQHLIDTPSMDDGGVHLNSTIVSGALWDLRQKLGKKTADTIVYRALTDYLTPLSDFVDARDAVLASAKSFRLSKDTLKVVQTAFDARGITAKWKATLYGKGTQVLIDRLNTGMYADMKASTALGWFAVPRTDANRTEPTSIWVGRTSGKGTPYRISPDDGSINSFPHTDGKRVVWLSIALDPASPTGKPTASCRRRSAAAGSRSSTAPRTASTASAPTVTSSRGASTTRRRGISTSCATCKAARRPCTPSPTPTGSGPRRRRASRAGRSPTYATRSSRSPTPTASTGRWASRSTTSRPGGRPTPAAMSAPSG